jgi:hypothetical protein
MADDRIEYFLRGYKQGLKEAWNEILKDGGSGYSVAELRMMIKSKIATIEQRAEAQAELLKKELGIEDYTPKSGNEGPEELIEGCSYLIKESSPDASYAILRYMISEKGSAGLCVTRKSARVLKEKYGLEGLTLIRLGKKETGNEILSSALGGITESPISSANLTHLYEKVVEYLNKNKGAVILIDGIEYPVSQNEFKSVMRFIQKRNDILEKYGAYMIITISPSSLEPTEMSILEREMTEVIEIS